MKKLFNFLRSVIFQQGVSRDDAYLAGARDCSDLERRMRVLDRAA
jgi:hypothetical protein